MAFKTFIEMSDPRYDQILGGIRESYQNSCILWIEEITNPMLEDEYIKQKEIIKNLRGTVNELQLYHGTNEKVANIIAAEGFNPLANRVSAYGKGTYFAKHASYSKQYAPPNQNDDISFMLICSVLIGETHVYGNNQQIDTTKHDNSVNEIKNSIIYVTPYQYGAIPRFLVAFYKNV